MHLEKIFYCRLSHKNIRITQQDHKMWDEVRESEFHVSGLGTWLGRGGADEVHQFAFPNSKPVSLIMFYYSENTNLDYGIKSAIQIKCPGFAHFQSSESTARCD